jgi:glutathione peroxidase
LERLDIHNPEEGEMNWLIASVMMLSMGMSMASADSEECPPLLRFSSAPLLGGDPVNFCEAYQGKVILAVNTASQCGYTSQFKGLESLYQEFKTKGLVILGFPSNDFKQEHEDPAQTAKVSFKDYGVTFPMFSKSAVTGDKANTFFAELTKQSGASPQWNFQKYLIDRKGNVIKVFPSKIEPDDLLLRLAVEAALAEKP